MRILLLVSFALLAACSSKPKKPSCPAINELQHKTDFLTMGDFTHLYPGRPPERQIEFQQAILARKYTHIYIYVYNENDYDRTKFNYYDNPQAYVEILKGLRKACIAPIVWLAADDSSGFHAANPPSKLRGMWSSFIPQIDQYVAGYVVGLEMNEYWNSNDQNMLGNHLRSLTGKPIFAHLTPGNYQMGLSGWSNGILYQYGTGLSAGQIAAKTRELAPRFHNAGKVFIAGEYNVHSGEAKSVELGNAAMGAGADGFGNGGTP